MCNCIARVNKHLAEHNTALQQVSMLNFKSGRCRQSLVIATQKLRRTDKGKPKIALPTFCPFCGKAIQKAKTSRARAA